MPGVWVVALAMGCLAAGVCAGGEAAMTNIYDFTMRDIDGADVNLSAFKGKVLLIVNVASRCGFTRQYAGLQTLQQTYGPRGFTVLGFPCNDFGAQEPGTLSGPAVASGVCGRHTA